jgi:hypothetical protein
MNRIALVIPTLALVAVTYVATTTHAADKTAMDKAGGEKADVSAAFGNTVFSIYPDGRSQKVWFAPDGTWTGLSRRGRPLAGVWTVKGPKICLKQSRPPTLPISFCQIFPEYPAKGMDAKDLTGTPIHLKLVKGHVES